MNKAETLIILITLVGIPVVIYVFLGCGFWFGVGLTPLLIFLMIPKENSSSSGLDEYRGDINSGGEGQGTGER